MLHCHDVSKRFGEFVALDGISFHLEGGICALLGPNGARKSTLLKILTGLLAPDRGEVLIAGSDVAKEPLRVKRIIGVLPEDLGLFDALTIEEHLKLCGPVYGLRGQASRARQHRHTASMFEGATRRGGDAAILLRKRPRNWPDNQGQRHKTRSAHGHGGGVRRRLWPSSEGRWAGKVHIPEDELTAAMAERWEVLRQE
jgi:ABC-type Fe3+/spermidine/putrescine transport system ATPase subunit